MQFNLLLRPSRVLRVLDVYNFLDVSSANCDVVQVIKAVLTET